MKLTASGAICPAAASGILPALRWKRFAALAAFAAAALAPTCAAQAAEHTLVGIRVFASVHDVLNKYGNPNRIITDASQFSATTTAGSSAGMGGASASPFMGGGGFGRRFGGPPGFGGPATGGAPMMGMPGGAPAEFGGAPGAAAMGNPYATPGAPGEAGLNGGESSASNGEVLYVYNRPGNVTYDFLLSQDGRVIQITVLGYKSSSVRTGRGLALGTLYTTMVGRYGYPESQSNDNGILTAKYMNRDHATFQLRNNKVVGITVAAVE